MNNNLIPAPLVTLPPATMSWLRALPLQAIRKPASPITGAGLTCRCDPAVNFNHEPYLWGSVTVTASATDNVGVTKVELYIDDTLRRIQQPPTVSFGIPPNTATQIIL